MNFRIGNRAWLVIAVIVSGLSLNCAAEDSAVLVVDRESGRAIAGATVRLSNSSASQEAGTDGIGRAVFAGVRPGLYRVEVEKAGYVDPGAGRGRVERFPPPGGTRLLVGLTRGIVISGQVTDDTGHPVSGMAVVAVERLEAKGQTRFVTQGNPDLTDTSGRYRLHHLPPGSYTVAARPAADEARSRFRGTFYYPGHGDASRAEFLELNAGDEISPIEIRVPAQALGSVAGEVTNVPEEWEGRRPAVAILPASGVRIPIAYAYPDSSGKVSMEDVPPGEYQLAAWGPVPGGDFSIPPEGAEIRYASSPVSVRSDDAAEVKLPLAPGIRVEVRVLAPPAGCSGLQSTELRSTSEWERWTFKAERTRDGFVWSNVPSGTYRFEMPALERSCTFAGVRIQGSSEPPRPVIMLTSSAVLSAAIAAPSGSVSGKLTRRQQPVKGAAIGLLAAQDAAVSAVTETDESGSFRFDRLPPGSYEIVPLTMPASKASAPVLSAKQRRQFTLEHSQSIQIDFNFDED